jgi:hypothetical protein
MNNRVKSGLFFGIAMTLFFFAENLLTHDHLSSKEILKFVISAIVSGSISGFLFSWVIEKFTTSKFVNKTTRIKIAPGEKMVFQTSANHFKAIEAVGGKLYLTNKNLIFKSHKLNIQNHELIIKLSDIKEIKRFRPMGLTDNGLSIHIHENRKEKFVVEKIEEWLLYLEQTKKRTVVA